MRVLLSSCKTTRLKQRTDGRALRCKTSPPGRKWLQKAVTTTAGGLTTKTTGKMEDSQTPSRRRATAGSASVTPGRRWPGAAPESGSRADCVSVDGWPGRRGTAIAAETPLQWPGGAGARHPHVGIHDDRRPGCGVCGVDVASCRVVQQRRWGRGGGVRRGKRSRCPRDRFQNRGESGFHGFCRFTNSSNNYLRHAVRLCSGGGGGVLLAGLSLCLSVGLIEEWWTDFHDFFTRGICFRAK